MSKIAIFGYPSCVQIPRQRSSPGTISVKFYVDVNGWPSLPNGEEKLLKISTGWIGRTNVTDDRQTDDRRNGDSSSRWLKTIWHQYTRIHNFVSHDDIQCDSNQNTTHDPNKRPYSCDVVTSVTYIHASGQTDRRIASPTLTNQCDAFGINEDKADVPREVQYSTTMDSNSVDEIIKLSSETIISANRN